MRLRSIYGSPNNVALYLGRVMPLLVAMSLLGGSAAQRRRWAYTLAILPIGLAILLTFSRGGLLLGIPAGLLVVFWIWQRSRGRSPWPWADRPCPGRCCGAFRGTADAAAGRASQSRRGDRCIPH